MGWSWRRARSTPRHAQVRGEAQPRGQETSPPPETKPPTLRPETPRETTATATVSSTGVRLGFADGSEVALAAADPRAVALRAVAEVLVQGET